MSEPDILSGMPVIKGTRVPIARILSLLKEGYIKACVRVHPLPLAGLVVPFVLLAHEELLYLRWRPRVSRDPVSVAAHVD